MTDYPPDADVFSPPPPRRWKELGELTADEHLALIRAKRTGERLRFETAEYAEARRKALARDGLSDDPERQTTVQEHLNEIRSDR